MLRNETELNLVHLALTFLTASSGAQVLSHVVRLSRRKADSNTQHQHTIIYNPFLLQFTSDLCKLQCFKIET